MFCVCVKVYRHRFLFTWWWWLLLHSVFFFRLWLRSQIFGGAVCIQYTHFREYKFVIFFIYLPSEPAHIPFQSRRVLTEKTMHIKPGRERANEGEKNVQCIKVTCIIYFVGCVCAVYYCSGCIQTMAFQTLSSVFFLFAGWFVCYFAIALWIL